MVSAIIQLRRGVLLTALAFVVCCSVTYSSQDSVEVTGEGTVDEKLNLAREIAAQVWNSGLTIRVHEHFLPIGSCRVWVFAGTSRRSSLSLVRTARRKPQ